MYNGMGGVSMVSYQSPNPLFPKPACHTQMVFKQTNAQYL